VELEQSPQERLRVLAREIAALDECDAMCEICERQPAGETRTVGALRRIGGRHELARSAAAQTTTPPQLLCFRHEVETKGTAVTGLPGAGGSVRAQRPLEAAVCTQSVKSGL
jgi:hypothetical protein